MRDGKLVVQCVIKIKGNKMNKQLDKLIEDLRLWLNVLQLMQIRQNNRDEFLELSIIKRGLVDNPLINYPMTLDYFDEITLDTYSEILLRRK